MISNLSLAERDLAMLLAGDGSSGTIGVLRAAQLSRHLVMLRGILDLAKERASEDAARAGLQDSYQVLSDLDVARPGSLHGLIGYPYVGEWAVTCLRRLSHSDDAADVPLWLDLAYLGAIAAAAAIVLDVQAEVIVPVRDGLVAVPSIGSFTSAMWPGRGWLACGVAMRGTCNLRVRRRCRQWFVWRPVTLGGCR